MVFAVWTCETDFRNWWRVQDFSAKLESNCDKLRRNCCSWGRGGNVGWSGGICTDEVPLFFVAVRLHDSIQEENFHYLVFDLWVFEYLRLLVVCICVFMGIFIQGEKCVSPNSFTGVLLRTYTFEICKKGDFSKWRKYPPYGFILRGLQDNVRLSKFSLDFC